MLPQPFCAKKILVIVAVSCFATVTLAAPDLAESGQLLAAAKPGKKGRSKTKKPAKPGEQPMTKTVDQETASPIKADDATAVEQTDKTAAEVSKTNSSSMLDSSLTGVVRGMDATDLYRVNSPRVDAVIGMGNAKNEASGDDINDERSGPVMFYGVWAAAKPLATADLRVLIGIEVIGGKLSGSYSKKSSTTVQNLDYSQELKDTALSVGFNYTFALAFDVGLTAISTTRKQSTSFEGLSDLDSDGSLNYNRIVPAVGYHNDKTEISLSYRTPVHIEEEGVGVSEEGQWGLNLQRLLSEKTVIYGELIHNLKEDLDENKKNNQMLRGGFETLFAKQYRAGARLGYETAAYSEKKYATSSTIPSMAVVLTGGMNFSKSKLNLFVTYASGSGSSEDSSGKSIDIKTTGTTYAVDGSIVF